MTWANFSQPDRIASLEAIVRQALQSSELLEEAANAVYSLSQQPQLSADERHLLSILNDAILNGDVQPVQPQPSPPVADCCAAHPGRAKGS